MKSSKMAHFVLKCNKLCFMVMQCSGGSYSAAAATACTSCSSGKYLTNASGGTDQSACTSCSSGKYLTNASGGTDQSACTSCSPGKYLTNAPGVTDQSACTSCSSGKYLTNASGATGQKSCTTVSIGLHVMSVAEIIFFITLKNKVCHLWWLDVCSNSQQDIPTMDTLNLSTMIDSFCFLLSRVCGSNYLVSGQY